jgi:WD40 repeat protein
MKSPFKFLDSFTKNDREIFFGRDREIEELYHRVFESKLMLVYGVSGTGKSSLIHCGLANKFQETDWLPLVIRRGGNIIESLASGIKTASITKQEGQFSIPSHFRKAVKSLYLDHYKPVFFIFDQFEELFIFGDKEERKLFIQVIKSLIESDLQCRLIFVMREEYMAGVTEFERYIPTFFSNRVRIEKMSHINALKAITEPCKVFNIRLEDGFAETLLEKLSPENADVELTYLQVFLDKIFRIATSDHKDDVHSDDGVTFTLELLRKTGNVSDLLGSFLDEQTSILNNPETGLIILKSFVSVKGTKQPMKVEEVRDYIITLGSNPEESVIRELIMNFVNLRILQDKDQYDRYELRHDALAVKIYEKFTIVEKELLEVRKYIENAFYIYESRKIMLSKQDLDYVAQYERKLLLPQYLSDFINNSKTRLSSRRKSLIKMTRISALIFVLIIAALLRSYLRSLENRELDRLIALELFRSQTNPAKGIFTALNLWEKDSSSPVLRYIILNDFQRLISMKNDSPDALMKLKQNFEPLILEARILNSDISQTGRYIFGWMDNNKVFVMNTLSNKVNYLKAEGELIHMELSDNDSLLALVYGDGTCGVYDLDGIRHYQFETTPNEVMNERLVHFFPSGPFQIASANGNSAFVYDKSGRQMFELKGHSGRINSIDISPDGHFISTASCDKQIFLWNYNYDTKQISVYDSLTAHSDTVWSCNFNHYGKYIITSSADSTIRIWDLLGKQLNPALSFARDFKDGPRYKYNKGEYDTDASNPVYSSYYRKVCDAAFSTGEREIIATGYSFSGDPLKNTIAGYNKVLYLDRYSSFLKWYNYSFLFPELIKDDFTAFPLYRNLVISPSGNMIAVVKDKTEKTYLVDALRLHLITIEGTNPLFSESGKEIFSINDKSISKFPVSPDAIKKLLLKFGLFEYSKVPSEKIVI